MLILIGRYGSVPWVSLILAASFGSYGLLRKKAGVNPLISLFLETLLLTPAALGFLLILAAQDTGRWERSIGKPTGSCCWRESSPSYR
ncbi:MAG: hypothetical protein R3F37_18585 [Candidatus Competibacteraceae bacterium]